MTKSLLITAYSLSLATILGVAPEARAQDALGAGDVLDANLNRLTGRRNVSAQRLDFRQRNLIVTGNVAGGRQFRGSVGYTSPDDFRGLLGGDETFAFRRDSALSSLGLVQYGSTFQDLRYAQDLGLLEYHRSARRPPLDRMTSAQTMSGDLTEARSRLDQVTLERSTAMRRERLNEPSVLGTAVTEDGRQLMLSASSLRGLALSTVDDESKTQLTSYDQARVQEDRRAGRDVSSLSLPTMAQLPDLRITDTRIDSSVSTDRRMTTANEEYINVLRRIAQRYAGSDVELDVQSDLLSGLDAQFRELRDQLSGRAQKPEETEPGTPVDRLRSDDGTTPQSTPTVQPDDPEPEPAEDGDPVLQDLARYGVMLKHGERLQHFAADRDDRFNELMRTAEERLKNHEYFWAERRFNRALRLMPSHPLAMAGVSHAQIGAGLYLPSALTLRRLLTRHPEMIDVLYADDLLPEQYRLRTAVAEIRQRLERSIEVAPHGFVLAYLGHQLGDPALIADGLAFMGTDPGDEVFVTLLRNVWIEE